MLSESLQIVSKLGSLVNIDNFLLSILIGVEQVIFRKPCSARKIKDYFT